MTEPINIHVLPTNVNISSKTEKRIVSYSVIAIFSKLRTKVGIPFVLRF